MTSQIEAATSENRMPENIEDMTDEQASDALAPQFPETPALPPVQVSGTAHKALVAKFRRWSGWSDATMILDNPHNHVKDALSDTGLVDTEGHVMYLNIDKVSLNPNRVLLTVNPFRLRQEAVMTGIMLHEAGHARHSHWREDEPATGAVHDDGKPVTEQAMALACLLEEPRVEGLMARDARQLGAARLGWTMRASAAHLLPITTLSRDPGQQIMDLISAWTLRAGRVLSVAAHTGMNMPPWVFKFHTFLGDEIEGWLESQDDDDAAAHAEDIIALLESMLSADEAHDYDTYMMDRARDVLELLYPKGDGEGNMPGGSCAVAGPEGSTSENSDVDPLNGTAVMLQQIEQQSDQETEANAESEEPAGEDESDEAPGGTKGGVGSGNWTQMPARQPSKDERELQKHAERFLRSIIAPVERNVTRLSDSPAATVDGAALLAWKAGGQVRAPKFFKQSRREVLPSPPVDVAILGDISGSMSPLQYPQAVLAWALSAATVDLSNFAGRGQQIRSCMIHWGDKAEVVQHVGQRVDGIREVPCNDGTDALGAAMRLIETEMPGFLDPPADGKPTNRLIVSFTDWDHSHVGLDDAYAQTVRALAAGVNIVSVTPGKGQGWYSEQRSLLNRVLRENPGLPGISSLTRYDMLAPNQVWEEAARALEAGR
jgi:hypothetical protein